ncbi:hypothetical protein O181_102256, partial [Austropuccinia psidii MF-1]|nr:hypothetical protein [Austropuccinia psidii MF-1]
TTLHRVLSCYLLPSTLQAIMTQVFSAIHLTLSKEFSKANVQSAHAKEQLLQDVQEAWNKKLLPKEAKSESNDDSAKDLPPTCPETKVAKSKVALEQNQTSSTIENEIEEISMQDNPTQSLGAVIPSLPIHPQPYQTHEPQLVLPLSETVTETSSPNPSQPPKLTLSQQLTALATN